MLQDVSGSRRADGSAQSRKCATGPRIVQDFRFTLPTPNRSPKKKMPASAVAMAGMAPHHRATQYFLTLV
jgi:hypothetical protein